MWIHGPPCVVIQVFCPILLQAGPREDAGPVITSRGATI